MQRHLEQLSALLAAALAIGLWLHGPIAQPSQYHAFADRRVAWGIANAADVLSNIGFAMVGVYGLYRLWPARRQLANAWPGYALFLAALVLTAFGSGYYHLAPDNARLVWDRLPIALLCAGLLAGVLSQCRPRIDGRAVAAALAVAAVLSVAWWYVTERGGQGDLRPYLLLQVLPLLMIPLWQAGAQAPRADRLAFGAAILLYVAAKLAELDDHEVFDAVHWLSGHTLKHLLATASAAVITLRLAERYRPASSRR